MIKLTNLSYTYPRKEEPALDSIDWTIEEGEFVLVTGPSGSGKSTLLRCLNGLIPHFSGGTISGSIIVGGVDVLSSSPRSMARKVGLVFQDPESQSVLDVVEDEIAFVLENAGIEHADMHQRVDMLLELLGLTELRERSLFKLSGGERQKVAIAAAMALNPAIVALDEPTSQLDSRSAEDLMLALMRINEEFMSTIIVVEQRLERVMPFSSRVATVQHGRISADTKNAHMESAPEDYSMRSAERISNQSHQYHEVESMIPVSLSTRDRHGSNGNLLDRSSQLPKNQFTSKPLLSIEDLIFGYESGRVLDGLDLQIEPGQAVAITGRNGSGKTTLLKCIVGLLRPNQGKITIDGQSIHDRSIAEICRDVAYLPQMPDDLLYADTVEDELRGTLTNHGLNPEGNIPSIDSMLNSLALTANRSDYPRDLSVGQRQRVAMGAVMITGPRLMLMDEPTRGLDRALKDKLVELWKRWLKNGMGLLLVSHDLELSRSVADKLLILENGRLSTENSIKGPAYEESLRNRP